MIKINHEKCVLCIGCASVCPFGAIELQGTRMKVNPEKCKNCGMCIRVCPADAISYAEEEKTKKEKAEAKE
ncbi:4Fe-4S binding protein [Candidatus Micrarchaeota archaeon]|nr:4Fe-4S binding protein [Candidatus Micrarchaeota archaeon]